MAQRRGKQRERADPPKTAHSGRPESDELGDSDGTIPEMMRRALTLGLSGFFTTEAALRKALEDTVPKDWTDFLADTSDRTRSEFLERMSGEIGRVLEGMDMAAVLKELLRGRTLEVKAEFRLSDEPTDNPNGSPKIRISTPDPKAKESGPPAHDADPQGDD